MKAQRPYNSTPLLQQILWCGVLALLLGGCDLLGDEPTQNAAPTGPAPPIAPTATDPSPTQEELENEVTETEKASSVVFDLISKRVHQCGGDAKCTQALGKQLENVNDASVKALIPVIQSSASVQVRTESMRMLAQRKVQEALPELVEILLKEKDPELQEAAAFALRDIGDPKAVKSLKEALENAPSLRLKETFIQALGGFQTSEAVQVLGQAGKEAGRDLFFITVAALGSTKHPDAVPFLSKAMSKGDKFIRFEAINGLTGIVTQEAESALRNISNQLTLPGEVRAMAKRNLADLSAALIDKAKKGLAEKGLNEALESNTRKLGETDAEGTAPGKEKTPPTSPEPAKAEENSDKSPAQNAVPKAVPLKTNPQAPKEK